jgi:hypothetical protein
MLIKAQELTSIIHVSPFTNTGSSVYVLCRPPPSTAAAAMPPASSQAYIVEEVMADDTESPYVEKSEGSGPPVRFAFAISAPSHDHNPLMMVPLVWAYMYRVPCI